MTNSPFDIEVALIYPIEDRGSRKKQNRGSRVQKKAKTENNKGIIKYTRFSTLFKP
jgi:hypothetical protein